VNRSLSSEQWRAIEKALPPGIDSARVRNELNRVLCLRAGLPPEQQRLLRRLQRDLDQAGALIGPGALDLKRVCAEALRRPRLFSLQCGILWAFDSAGGDCGVVTPYKGKDEAHWPKPTGPVISYYRAASRAVFGKDLSAERVKVLVNLYQHLRFSAASLTAAGAVTARLGMFDATGQEVVDDSDRSKI
jgi:hypothetical protein